jgi:hypothetical protein
VPRATHRLRCWCAPLFTLRAHAHQLTASRSPLTPQRLRRTLGETDKEVTAFRALFEEFLGTEEDEWEARRAWRAHAAGDAALTRLRSRPQPLVGLRRASLVPLFFEYLQVRISSLDAATMEAQREELATAAARLLALVEMHDSAVKDAATLESSFETFQSLLASATSYEDIDAKIDAMAGEGKLDPALLLTASKMYMSVKESDYTSEEVKDIMAHLYWKARHAGRACHARTALAGGGSADALRCANATLRVSPLLQMKASMAELQPPEVRILKHLLSMEDPLERRAGYEQAFTPGPELNAGQEDMLCTCVRAH